MLSQTSTELNDHFTWFDAVIGQGNTDIYNGIVYREKYKTEENNHKFFLLNEYRLGNLVYNHQTYYNVNMKYDLYEDELVVKLPNKSFNIFIKLTKENINEFSIKDFRSNRSSKEHRFITNSLFDNNEQESVLGFYEVIDKTSRITLLKKHHKRRKEYIKDLYLFSKFSSNNYFAVVYENKIYKIESKKDLIRVFPNMEKEISAFYKQERKLLKADKGTFFTILLKNIEKNTINTDTE